MRMAAVSDKADQVKTETDTRVKPEVTITEKVGMSQQKGGETLEDLCSILRQQISSSNWLQENTAEKWAKENPELAKEFTESSKKT